MQEKHYGHTHLTDDQLAEKAILSQAGAADDGDRLVFVFDGRPSPSLEAFAERHGLTLFCFPL